MMPVSSAISRTAASSGVSFALQVPLRQAPLETARAVAARDDGGVVDALATADDDAARGGLVDDRQGCGRDPRDAVAGVDAQRMTARRRWHAPGDGWTRRARHIDTVTTWAPSRPAREGSCRSAYLAGLDECPPSIRPSAPTPLT